jgi:hypothetical protein
VAAVATLVAALDSEAVVAVDSGADATAVAFAVVVATADAETEAVAEEFTASESCVGDPEQPELIAQTNAAASNVILFFIMYFL